jgi:hypothetical protein
VSGAPGERAPLPPVVRVTCARDGCEHWVADEAVTPESAGRYPALCGHRVLAVGLACPSGPPCRACVRVRRSAEAAARAGSRPPGVWRRLVDRFRRFCVQHGGAPR